MWQLLLLLLDGGYDASLSHSRTGEAFVNSIWSEQNINQFALQLDKQNRSDGILKALYGYVVKMSRKTNKAWISFEEDFTFKKSQNTVQNLTLGFWRSVEGSAVLSSKGVDTSHMFLGSGLRIKGNKGFWINSKSMCVIRLPPGYYPYLGQMPGPRDPNQGPNQGYGQGGYNSLNRGNQVRQ